MRHCNTGYVIAMGSSPRNEYGTVFVYSLSLSKPHLQRAKGDFIACAAHIPGFIRIHISVTMSEYHFSLLRIKTLIL